MKRRLYHGINLCGKITARPVTNDADHASSIDNVKAQQPARRHRRHRQRQNDFCVKCYLTGPCVFCGFQHSDIKAFQARIDRDDHKRQAKGDVREQQRPKAQFRMPSNINSTSREIATISGDIITNSIPLTNGFRESGSDKAPPRLTSQSTWRSVAEKIAIVSEC